MTTTEPTTEESALWASIGEMPECQLRRGVAADWYEDRAGKAECKKCGPPRAFPPYQWTCPTCKGTGYIPDRSGRMAAALRATVKYVPEWMPGHGVWSWQESEMGNYWYLTSSLFSKLSGRKELRVYCDYHTATSAIRDLCEAWCKVTYGEAG